MRLVFRLAGVAFLLLVLLVVGAIGDLLFNRGRMVYGALGRDALIAACRPALIAKLTTAGFQPDDLLFDEEPDIAISTSSVRTLTEGFTFVDGPQGARVDGTMSCRVRGTTVSLEVQTQALPMRAT